MSLPSIKISLSMSKKKPALNYKRRQPLPPLKRIKTTWDLKGLYYLNEHDPKLCQDMKAAERVYLAFAKKWRGKPFTKKASLLKTALTEYEALCGLPEATRAGRYFALRLALNAGDAVAEKKQAKLSEWSRHLTNETLFFPLALGKIPPAKQKIYLTHPELTHFHYYLKQVFLSAKYDLSEAEEKIIKLKSPQASFRWVDAVEKIISNRAIIWRGRSLPIPEAMETIDLLDKKGKQTLWALLMKEMEQIAEVAEHEFNAIITDARGEDVLRGYKKPYSATALSYEDSETSIENLVAAVSTKGFKLSRKFYKLKAAYHGKRQLHYTQKYDSIGSAPQIPFKQAVEICRDVFYGLKPGYGEIFDELLTGGQIDVYPRRGKRGGAFMSDQTGHPIHVFLNHLANFKSMETLAHEMGHAIHAKLSGRQSPFYDGHSIVTAETASTLFENFLFDAVYEAADATLKPTLLHDRITRDIATIERQITFFNCELEIHETIHQQGAMTKEELRDCMHRHLKAYLGPAVSLRKTDGYSYVYIPHLRYGFYVYTYAFGILMSTIMANQYRMDPGYINQIDKFLSAGSSAQVADIFKSIGINTRRPDTFVKALDNHATDITNFRKFTPPRSH